MTDFPFDANENSFLKFLAEQIDGGRVVLHEDQIRHFLERRGAGKRFEAVVGLMEHFRCLEQIRRPASSLRCDPVAAFIVEQERRRLGRSKCLRAWRICAQAIVLYRDRNDKDPPADAAELPARLRKVWSAYGSACERFGRGKLLQDKEAFDLLKRCDEVEWSFRTFRRYLSDARKRLGKQKNLPRCGRPHGRSIVKECDI